eukprot:1468706-Prymnesium_polylepis.1
MYARKRNRASGSEVSAEAGCLASAAAWPIVAARAAAITSAGLDALKSSACSTGWPPVRMSCEKCCAASLVEGDSTSRCCVDATSNSGARPPLEAIAFSVRALAAELTPAN